jgi:hypothetical protein
MPSFVSGFPLKLYAASGQPLGLTNFTGVGLYEKMVVDPMHSAAKERVVMMDATEIFIHLNSSMIKVQTSLLISSCKKQLTEPYYESCYSACIGSIGGGR